MNTQAYKWALVKNGAFILFDSATFMEEGNLIVEYTLRFFTDIEDMMQNRVGSRRVLTEDQARAHWNQFVEDGYTRWHG